MLLVSMHCQRSAVLDAITIVCDMTVNCPFVSDSYFSLSKGRVHFFANFKL